MATSAVPPHATASTRELNANGCDRADYPYWCSRRAPIDTYQASGPQGPTIALRCLPPAAATSPERLAERHRYWARVETGAGNECHVCTA